jgi:hypothetical protein
VDHDKSVLSFHGGLYDYGERERERQESTNDDCLRNYTNSLTASRYYTVYVYAFATFYRNFRMEMLQSLKRENSPNLPPRDPFAS